MSQQRGLERALQDFRKAQKEFEKYEGDLPRIIGVEAVRWIHGNFDKQGYMGTAWEPRSAATNASYDKRSGVKGSVFNSGNPILKQTGNLYDAIRKSVEGMRVFTGFDTRKIPYGVIHNEGGTIEKVGAWRTVYFANNRITAKGKGAGRNVIVPAHEIKEPKRQFMPMPSEPENPEIIRIVMTKLKKRLTRILRKFEV